MEEDALLDWDKPLSEQPEKVADALPKLRRETKAQNYDDVIEFLIGAGQMKKETAE